MQNRTFKTLSLFVALFFLQACSSSSRTEPAGAGGVLDIAATAQEILDRSRLAIIDSAFPGLPSGAPTLKSATEPITPCKSISNTESCDGGGSTTTTSASCMEFENRVREWDGNVTFETCGPLPLSGHLAFTLTFGPIPEGCSETFCPWTVPLKLVFTESPDGPLTAAGAPVSLMALFEGDLLNALPDLTLTDLQLQIGVHSCRQESGPGSAIVCGNDIDGDGVPDDLDSCPAKFNPSQADTDSDGLGDRCDDNVTGESDEELACLAKVDVAACVTETDGDCCEGQFCSTRGVCETCSDLSGVVGLACRPGHPNDCCPGQFCSVNQVCELCPRFGGDGDGSFQPVSVCFSLDPFDENSATCTSDQQCQTQADAGVYDGPLLSGGFEPSSAQPYTCGFGGNECCTVITQIVEACQGSAPPPDEACADAVLECTGAAGYVGTTDLDAACDAVAKDFSDTAASGSCGGTCCTISCGGTEADCSATGTDYCLATYGEGSQCVDGCCLHAPDDGGGGDCNGLSGCGQYGANANAFCNEVAGRGYACVDDCCIPGPQETNCQDGVDDEPDGSIDCADSDCRFAPGCVEDCNTPGDDDGDTLINCADDADCFCCDFDGTCQTGSPETAENSFCPDCITCPSGTSATTEQCDPPGETPACGFDSGNPDQFCDYNGCCQDIACGDYFCSAPAEACDTCEIDCGPCGGPGPIPIPI